MLALKPGNTGAHAVQYWGWSRAVPAPKARASWRRGRVNTGESTVLKRVLGSTDAAWLVAGNMIGAGIFITPGLVAGTLPGTLWPLVVWALGGVLALAGAAVYGELGARLPHAGGDYQYLHVAFGPLWGFLTGWAALIVTFSGAAAVMAIVAFENLATAWPVLMRFPAAVRGVLPAVAVVALTLANVAGARIAGKTTAWLTALPVAGLVLLFGWGVLVGGGRAAADAAVPDAGALRISLVGLGAAMVPVFFTYSGWNAAAYVAGEIDEPARNLPRGLLLGTLATTAFYVAFNGFLLWILPRPVMAGSTTAAALVAERLLGVGAERVLALLIALAVLGSANVTLMAGARIYYAMALDGLAPRALATTNAAGVPSAALWAGGVWTALLAMSGRIEMLVNWATLSILLLSSLAVLALFVLRRTDVPHPGTTKLYRCPGYPFTPILYLLVAFGVALASAVRDWRQALYGALVVAAGIPVYALLRLRRRRGLQ